MSLCFSFLQAELTFCAGDVITVFGEIDEDGFYYVSAQHFHFDDVGWNNLKKTCTK